MMVALLITSAPIQIGIFGSVGMFVTV